MPIGHQGSQDGSQHGMRRICAGRGHNHGRAGRAIAALAALWLGGALVAAGAVLSPPALAQSDNPLVQRNVPAEATAENAVVARDRALAAGQRIAYERMAEALGLPRTASDSQIESMVASLVIESERVTQRGYSARITVNFNPPGSGMARAPAAPPPVPGGAAQGGGGAAVATVEAAARYRSFGEYVELTRRLGASPAVARVEVVSVSGEMARFRLGLRSQPGDAVAELGRGGVQMAQGDPRLGEGWRLGLGLR
ncbi:hypothetical protein [Falsiroseomonas oryzae]|uniref:hypothetical protein n=1 Tax=Falsiroseomonas oryzae TaxID=2766473 RepID=UPI0022EB9668|nr:hypothetical protein [Roseomonas sp. MO-31]